MKIKDFELHLFDLDDTLIQTTNSYLFAYQRILRNFSNSSKKLPSLEEIDVFCRIFGSGQPELVFAAIFDFYGWDCQWEKADIAKEFWREFWNKLEIFSDVFAYLDLLKNKQKKIAIVSNGKSEIQNQKIKQLGLGDFFSSKNIFISSDFQSSQAKPSPFMIHSAIKKNRSSHANTIFYGNSDSDILSGRLAKIAVVKIMLKLPVSKKALLPANYCFTSWNPLVSEFLL
jgi:phosphoglycolate phosphatase-like HAD superfamily hydrolase